MVRHAASNPTVDSQAPASHVGGRFRSARGHVFNWALYSSTSSLLSRTCPRLRGGPKQEPGNMPCTGTSSVSKCQRVPETSQKRGSREAGNLSGDNGLTGIRRGRRHFSASTQPWSVILHALANRKRGG